jgi:hypothetical protein
MTAVVFTTLILLVYRGLSYYNLSLEDRVYDTDHSSLKPSGILGHGYGMLGSLFMIVGVGSYMLRKRSGFMARKGLVKHWLEFHIFLCTLGPLLILFHTAFKFGGLVAISFWSMVAVFLSGIIGRFIYIQIPRSIEGRELSLNELREMKTNEWRLFREKYNLDENSLNLQYHANPAIRYMRRYREDRKAIQFVKRVLRQKEITSSETKKIVALVKDDISLGRKIEMLETMQNLFRYWHVVHLPFAFVMLIIMVIHVGVTILFGYRWIF